MTVFALPTRPAAASFPSLPPGTPVVRRSTAALQIGFGVALPDAPRGAEQALRRLDGRTSVETLSAATGVELCWLRRTVSELTVAGVLQPPVQADVAVAGTGSIATAVRHGLSDLGPVRSWSDGSDAADVVVVATDGVGPDRVVTDDLTRRGIAHLVVSAAPGGAAVGPFVWPGASPCQRCCDLTLSARDGAWAYLAPQLAAVNVALDAATISWAAGLCAAHVGAFVRGGEPESLGRTWELAGGRLSVRDWPRRPDCPCALDAA